MIRNFATFTSFYSDFGCTDIKKGKRCRLLLPKAVHPVIAIECDRIPNSKQIIPKPKIKVKERKMEKYIRNRLEAIAQDVTANSVDYLKEELVGILESNKPYMTKTDHIAYSIHSLDQKIQLMDEQIKELTEYKKRLKYAKEIVLTTGAEVLDEYGISKMEGGAFSSITTTKASKSTKLQITITNEAALIDGGFTKQVLDMDMLTQCYKDGKYKRFIEDNAVVEMVTTIKPSKLKINKRRAVNNTNNPSTQIDDAA
jgi:hypothetical protein